MTFASPQRMILFFALACGATACTSAPAAAPSPSETKASDSPPAKTADDPGAAPEHATAAEPSADQAPSRFLFRNVHVFDGRSETRIENANVLVEGNLIKAVSTERIPADGATVIDGGGRTLMPGLADTHVHIAFATLPTQLLLNGLESYNYIRSTVDAKSMLMRGLTVVRDMGGDTFGLKQAIDEGLVEGPRIYPAGAALSQTAGHFDFRAPNQKHARFGGPRVPY